MPVQSGFGVVGIPDFICCGPSGEFIAIETKAPGKRANTTPNQERVLAELAAHNALVIVVDDVTQLETLI
jgi:hypothetical protein